MQRLATVKNELYVGVFLLGVLLLSGVALVLRPRTKSLLGVHNLTFTVEHGQGLQSGSPVLVQGIQVGEIEVVELTPDNKVRVICGITNQFRENIREDAAATVIPPALLGTTTVEIYPGVSKEPFPEEEELPVRKQESFVEKLQNVERRVDVVIERVDTFVAKAVGTLDEFRKMVDRIDKSEGIAGELIHDKGMAEDAKETMASLRSLATRLEQKAVPEVESTLTRAQEVLDESRALAQDLRRDDGRMQQLLVNLDQTVRELREAIAQAKVGETTATLRETADSFAKTASELGQETRPLTRDARRMLAALQQASEAMQKLSQELARQPNSVIWGREPEASPGLRR